MFLTRLGAHENNLATNLIRTLTPEDIMSAIIRIAAAADRAPKGAVEDAVGLALLCLLAVAGFALTGLA